MGGARACIVDFPSVWRHNLKPTTARRWLLMLESPNRAEFPEAKPEFIIREAYNYLLWRLLRAACLIQQECQAVMRTRVVFHMMRCEPLHQQALSAPIESGFMILIVALKERFGGLLSHCLTFNHSSFKLQTALICMQYPCRPVRGDIKTDC